MTTLRNYTSDNRQITAFIKLLLGTKPHETWLDAETDADLKIVPTLSEKVKAKVATIGGHVFESAVWKVVLDGRVFDFHEKDQQKAFAEVLRAPMPEAPAAEETEDAAEETTEELTEETETPVAEAADPVLD